MSYELLWEAKNVLEPLLKEAQMKGSTCWGQKAEFNMHSGPNLVFCIGKEMITISQPNDRLVIRQFVETEETDLGERVKKLLHPGSQQKSFFPVYTVACKLGWRNEFDAGLAGETDNYGAGSRELIEKIFSEHEKVHPGCDPANVEIFNPQMVKIGRLNEFLVLKK
jgi:hypothetical protein